MALTQTPEEGLKVSNAPSDGKFLQYKDSTDKLTWADVPDSVGGANGADVNDGVSIRWGSGLDLSIYHTGGVDNKNYIRTDNGDIRIGCWSSNAFEDGLVVKINGAVEAYYDDSKKFSTTTGGIGVIGAVSSIGATDLTLNTNAGTNSGSIVITDAANGDITLTPNGTGDVVIDGLKYPQADGSSGQYLKTDGSGQLSWDTVSAGTALTGSTDNTICTVTGANAIQGEANLKFDGTELTLAANRSNTAGTGHVSIAPGDTTSIWTIRHDQTGNDLWFDRGTDSSSTALVGFSADGNIKLTSGKGIDFSATADTGASNASMSNELLDDYEEGSWEPAAYSGCTSVGHFGSHYVKVGNLCTVWAYIHQVAGATGSSVFKVDGLPFTAHSQDSYPGSCITHGVDNTAGGAMYVNPIIEGNSDRLKLMGSGDENAWYQLNGDHVGNGDTIMIGITYRTT